MSWTLALPARRPLATANDQHRSSARAAGPMEGVGCRCRSALPTSRTIASGVGSRQGLTWRARAYTSRHTVGRKYRRSSPSGRACAHRYEMHAGAGRHAVHPLGRRTGHTRDRRLSERALSGTSWSTAPASTHTHIYMCEITIKRRLMSRDARTGSGVKITHTASRRVVFGGIHNARRRYWLRILRPCICAGTRYGAHQLAAVERRAPSLCLGMRRAES